MTNRIFYTCCFTGPRPHNLPWGYNEIGEQFKKIKQELYNNIITAIQNSYKFFITGMAQGIDIIAAEIVLELKKQFNQIELECAIPCINQTFKWSKDYICRYNNILANASKITYVTPSLYTPMCMQKRNKYMVDNSSLIIAVYSGKKGGTKNTIDYAIKMNRKINIISI